MKTLIQLLILLFFASGANATTNITTCQTLSAADTYVLQNDVTANGDCFKIAAQGVTIDLNGHTVTYDNASPLTVTNGSFESALSGSWDVTGAANATRAAGVYLSNSVYVGSYALKITTPTANQQVQSVGTVTLQPNTQYSLSGMVYNQVDDAVTLGIAFDGTAITASRSGKTYRGMQYIYTQFTTGASPISYKINLTVSGASSVASGSVYFDDIRVQQSGHHAVSPSATWARQVTVKNGTITQGQAHGDWSHAIDLLGLIPSDNPGPEVTGITFNVSGNSTKAINNSFLTNGAIHHNIFNSTVDTIEVRDHYDGALVYVSEPSSNGTIHGNTFNSGIQTAIFARSEAATNRLTIYDNDITLQSKYTNDFAIVSYGGYGDIIHDNIVRCGSGNNTCRGIYETGNGGTVYNNTVDVHYRMNNQEYNGCGGSAYGIQLEDGASNVEVYGNTVTANADECGAVAFRYYGPDSTTAMNNYVHNNTFKAVAVNGSSNIASTVMILESYASHLNFASNVLETNSNWIFIDGIQAENDLNRSLTLDSNTFKLNYPKASFYKPLIDATYGDGTLMPRNVTLSNNIYYDSTVAADMASAVFYSRYTGYSTPDIYAYNVQISTGSIGPGDVCDALHLSLCTDISSCEDISVGGHWYNSTCNASAQVSTKKAIRIGSKGMLIGGKQATFE